MGLVIDDVAIVVNHKRTQGAIGYQLLDTVLRIMRKILDCAVLKIVNAHINLLLDWILSSARRICQREKNLYQRQ